MAQPIDIFQHLGLAPEAPAVDPLAELLTPLRAPAAAAPAAKRKGARTTAAAAPNAAAVRSFVDETRQNRGAGSELEDLFGAEGEDADALRKYADQILGMQSGVDLRPFAALTDAWTGSNFASSLPKAMSEIDKLEAAAKVRSLAGERERDIAKGRIDLRKSDNTQDNVFARALAQMDNGNKGFMRGLAEDRLTFGQERDADDRLERLQREINPFAKARTTYGTIGKLLQDTARLRTLTGSRDDKNQFTPQQVGEMAEAVNRLVSAGGAGSEARIKAVTPESFRGDYQKAVNYFANNPGGAEQGAFIEVLEDLAKREAQTAQEQIDTIQNRILPAYPAVYSNPRTREALYQMMRGYQWNPEEVDKAFAPSKRGQPTQEKEALPQTPKSKGPVLKAGDVIDGYRFKGGDPKDQNNWTEAK